MKFAVSMGNDKKEDPMSDPNNIPCKFYNEYRNSYLKGHAVVLVKYWK